MSLLHGKTVLITGGTTGIGFATARRLVEEGAYVIITGRRQAELDDAVQRLDGDALGVQGNVSDLDDLDRLFAVIGRTGLTLDAVFANAGTIDLAPLTAVTERHVDQLLDINLKGVIFTVQKALPYLSDGASIILSGSANGSRGDANLGIYSATKAALRSLARTWAHELSDRNIRVNVVSPGPTNTEGFRELAISVGAQPDAFIDMAGSSVPLGRVGRPDEVANAVLFLASGLSTFTTGAEIPVDGGINAI